MKESDKEDEKGNGKNEGSVFMVSLKESIEMTHEEVLDEETVRMAKRFVVIRISTKHVNLWMRQLELKRKDMIELAGLMGIDGAKEEIK